MEQAGVQLIAAGGDVYITTMNSATKSTNTFVDATEHGGGRVSGAGQVMIGALRKVGAVAVEAFGQALKATSAFIGDSIGLAGDFEAGMLSFQSVAGKDVDTKGLEEFRDLFLDIGKRLPVSTAEVQQAAIEMVKGGIDPATIAAGGLEQNIQFAAAAMSGDLVKAAEISSKIMGGWAGVNATAAEKADFLTHATDLLTKAANASATDVEGLSQGIFNAQGIARAAGVGFDDLTTTLAALAPRFASSSEAGNSLKNMIARLQPTTIPAQDAMKALGLLGDEIGNKFFDATGKFVGFEQASQVLQDSLVGLNEKQRASILQTIFGNDAMSAASALSELGAQGYQNMAAALENANGVQAAAALKQQGFNTALDNAKGSVEALQITIGSALLPVLTDLMNNIIAPAINTLTDMSEALGGNEEAFNRLSPTAQAIVSTLDVLIADVQDIIGAFDDAGAETDAFASSIGDLADDLGLPGGLIKDVVSGLQDLSKWFGTADDKSSDLGSGIEDLNGIWEKAQDVINDVAAGYMAIIGATLPIVSKFVDEHGEAISAFFKTSWDSIIQIVNLALDIYDAIVPPILTAIAGFISDHASEIQKVLTGAWDIISTLISGTLDIIKGVFKTTLALINGDWEGAWSGIKGIVDTVGKTIEGVVEGFLNIIAGFFDTSLDGILKTWEDNWNMALDIINKIDWVAAGNSVVEGIIEGVKGMAGSLFAALEQMAQDAYDAFMRKIKGSSPAQEFVPAGQSMVQGIMLGFESMIPALKALVSDLGDDLVKQAADIASEVQSAIGDAFGATASIDRQKIANMKALEKVAPERQAGVQQQINEAEKVAQTINDPQQAAAYFKLRSQQAIELGKLNDEINAETDKKKREQLVAQYQLLNAAHNAELSQLTTNQAGGSVTQGLIDMITSLLSNKNIPGVLDNATVKALYGYLDMLRNASHRALGGPVAANKPYWVGEHGPELFWPQMNGMVSPSASSAQIAARGNQTTYNGQVGNTYNMPVYTNNSPGAIQQSWAIMQASMA